MFEVKETIWAFKEKNSKNFLADSKEYEDMGSEVCLQELPQFFNIFEGQAKKYLEINNLSEHFEVVEIEVTYKVKSK